MCVLIVLRRVGPYHHARFTTAAQQLPLTVLETRPQSTEYPWAFQAEAAYPIHQLNGQPHPEDDPPRPVLQLQLENLLAASQPKVIVSVGWADRTYQQLLLLAQQRRIPLVIISDSRYGDEPRRASKEWIKRQLLRGYSAALVAGQESRAYLMSLGIPAETIAQPWDVVDTQFFAQAATQASLRQPHFLCVSRLMAKKNHRGLLQAYSAYQRQGGRWDLLLVGSGPLEACIRTWIAALPDPTRVRLMPFCQLEQLSGLYSQASAFVLASCQDTWGLVVNEAMAAGLPCLVSSACGCAVDLIDHGVSGWCFDPADPAALTTLMHTAEQQAPAERRMMVAAARERLQAFSLASFASGLQQAVRTALRQPRFSRRACLAAQLLSRRP